MWRRDNSQTGQLCKLLLAFMAIGMAIFLYRVKPMVRQKPETRETLLARLDTLGIAYTEYFHPPVFTVKEAKELRGAIPGAHCKSLFLQDKVGALFLIISLEWRPLNMKELGKVLSSQRLFMANRTF
jgi:hypothetical protein